MAGMVGDWGVVVESWAMSLRAAGRAETTIATRTDHVRRMARAVGVPVTEVTGTMLVEWAGRQSWALETRRSVRSSVALFFRWANASGIVEADPSCALPTVAPGPAMPRPAPEAAYRSALGRADERTRLILRLAGEAGLRRGEIAVIHSRDLVQDLLGWSLVVHGKGGKVRVVPLPVPLALELRGRGTGFVFPGDMAGHLSPRWVGTLARRVLPETWTVHTLRHRFATRAYALDRDLLVVQTLLGHASPVTTRRYVALDDERLRRTVLGVAS